MPTRDLNRPEGSNMPQDENAAKELMNTMWDMTYQFNLGQVGVQMFKDATYTVGLWANGHKLSNPSAKKVLLEKMEARMEEVHTKLDPLHEAVLALDAGNEASLELNPDLAVIAKLPLSGEFMQRLEAVRKENREVIGEKFRDVIGKAMNARNLDYREPFEEFDAACDELMVAIESEMPAMLEELGALKAEVGALAELHAIDGELASLNGQISELGEVKDQSLDTAVTTFKKDIADTMDYLGGELGKTNAAGISQRVVTLSSDASTLKDAMQKAGVTPKTDVADAAEVGGEKSTLGKITSLFKGGGGPNKI